MLRDGAFFQSMIKLLAIAFSVAAIALSTSFAECSGGGCEKPAPTATPAP